MPDKDGYSLFEIVGALIWFFFKIVLWLFMGYAFWYGFDMKSGSIHLWINGLQSLFN